MSTSEEDYVPRFKMKFILFILFLQTQIQVNFCCDRSRTILEDPSGTFGNYKPNQNYTQGTHCEWLIQPKNQEFITLEFLHLDTECGYDYVFVYDGESKLLGSFSGKSIPEPLIAQSGKMSIVFYSDTNYVLSGFQAKYQTNPCPNDCSGQGKCDKRRCLCNSGYKGLDCGLKICPDQCGNLTGKGYCDLNLNQCICQPGYSGIDCSLDENNFIGK